MATFLFDEIIFGPIKSRRLGNSLGINLLPEDVKYCTYDCIYCECGWTYSEKFKNIKMHSALEVKVALENKLKTLLTDGNYPDNITFAGNGEPTAHPEFSQIIEDTILLKNTYFPKAKISVLSNATQLHKEKIRLALEKTDHTILKLDAADNELFQLINRPQKNFSLEKLIENLKAFSGRLIIQTMFLRGEIEGKNFDNTTPDQLQKWIELLQQIKPYKIMIYSIDRDTPAQKLIKCSAEELNNIVILLKNSGFDVASY